MLESSLLRSEARLERVAAHYADAGPPPRGRPAAAAAAAGEETDTGGDGGTSDGMGGAADDGEPVGETPFAPDASLLAEEAADGDEGRRRWEAFLGERFVAGGDDEFDYARVDGDEELDVQVRADEEERWYDEEEPRWAGNEADVDDADVAGGGVVTRDGETGVQDF